MFTLRGRYSRFTITSFFSEESTNHVRRKEPVSSVRWPWLPGCRSHKPPHRPWTAWLDVVTIGLALMLTAALHQFSYVWHPAWSGIVEHLYAAPILWAALRAGWCGGLLAGLFSVAAVFWIGQGLPAEVQKGLVAEAPAFLLIGGVTGWMASRWRKSEARMINLKAELQQRDELLAHSDKLTAAGELAVGLAHELRHPVASIKGAVALLQDLKLKPDVRAECLGILDRECDRVERLLVELLRFARPRSPVLEPMTGHAVVDAAFVLSRYAAGNAQVELRKEIDPDLPDLLGDPEQIKQVFVNLLLNALHAMPDGGTVLVRVRRHASSALVEVVDEGTGIAPELMDKIFLPFVTTRSEGTGLGLSIAKQIIAQHGADLTAEKNPQRGMTFRFLLPFSEEQE